jgi:hypothetical protein
MRRFPPTPAEGKPWFCEVTAQPVLEHEDPARAAAHEGQTQFGEVQERAGLLEVMDRSS